MVSHARHQALTVSFPRKPDNSSRQVAGSAAGFGGLFADETDKWAKVVKFSGVKPESHR
jgi:hypothetical protein